MPTFGDWFNGRFWREWVVAQKNKPTEVRSKKIIYRLYLEPRFKDTPLDQIDVSAIAEREAQQQHPGGALQSAALRGRVQRDRQGAPDGRTTHRCPQKRRSKTGLAMAARAPLPRLTIAAAHRLRHPIKPAPATSRRPRPTSRWCSVARALLTIGATDVAGLRPGGPELATSTGRPPAPELAMRATFDRAA